MPSVSKIAERARVSKSTVSLVLNNHSRVREATRRRVLQAVEDLRRESPPSTTTDRTPINILLIHPVTLGSSQVFREILQGIQTGTQEARARVTLAVNQFPLESNHATHVLLHDRALKPDGVIVIGARRDDPILDQVRAEQLPCVLVGRQEAPPDVSAVGMDNVTGTREAVEYLLGLGHTRIAFVGGNEAYDYTHLRRQGYIEAMKASGNGIDGLEFLGAADEAARDFLAAKSGATAALFVNDEHFLNAAPILARAGKKIPRDLSVVSFDDTDDIARHVPPVTSVAVPRSLMGYWAARVIADTVRNPEIGTIRILLRTRLSVRSSCAAPQNHV